MEGITPPDITTESDGKGVDITLRNAGLYTVIAI